MTVKPHNGALDIPVFLKIRYNSAEILGGQAERIDLQTGPDIHVAGEYRLDNRAALCRHLDLPLGVREDELIGHAYLAMGAEPHCAALLGDFAYALFDGRHRRLHLVRDPLGVMPLYYHLGEGVCTVSTSLDVMLSQPDIPHDLDEGVVAEWSRYGHVVSQTDTFYTAIKKVPRATLLRIEEGTTQAVNYWSVDDLAPLRYRNEGDYVEHLHDLLRTAVHDRAGEGENLGAHSSGGLDSTPIAILAGRTCHAQGREFHTYNWCKPESDIAAACHEWSDARDVSLSEGFIHHETGITTVQLEHSLLRHNIARDGSTMFEYERLVLAQAQADGVTRTFSGFGGDELLTSRSRDRHTGAIRQGRLLHALRHLMLESDPKQSMRLPRLALDYARLLRRAWWPVPPHRHPALQQAAQRHHAHLSLLRPEFAAFAAVQREPERDYFLAERIVDKQRIMLDMGYHQERDRKSTRLNSSHIQKSRMPSSA